MLNAERPHLYLALLMFMQGGLMGTFASIDIFFFYFFHEFALIPTFIMIGIWGGAGRRSAAIEMTIYLTLGAMLSLLGLIALYIGSGAESFSLIELRDYLAATAGGHGAEQHFALLLFGFGILVSLFPFHSWAPKGYAVAPTGAAMLHAGVLKKFGLYGLLQIAAPLLPEGRRIGCPGSCGWLGNILIIGLITIAQRDLKMMLGYSSVMHMGYAFLGIATFSVVGIGGAADDGCARTLRGLAVHAVHLYLSPQSDFDMQHMGGLATRAPVLCPSLLRPPWPVSACQASAISLVSLPSLPRSVKATRPAGSCCRQRSGSFCRRSTACGPWRIFSTVLRAEFASHLESAEIRDIQWFEKIPAGL